jgi:hypothetical protein
MAVDLLDVGVAAEVVGAVDHPVDLAEHLDGVRLEVQCLPGAAALDLPLAQEQVVQSSLGLAQDVRRQAAHLGQLVPVGVDGAFQADHREQDVAHLWPEIAQPRVVEQAPEGEERVEVGLVRIDRPVALG